MVKHSTLCNAVILGAQFGHMQDSLKLIPPGLHAFDVNAKKLAQRH